MTIAVGPSLADQAFVIDQRAAGELLSTILARGSGVLDGRDLARRG